MCADVDVIERQRARPGFRIVAHLDGLAEAVAYFGREHVRPEDLDGVDIDRNVCLCGIDVEAIAARAGWPCSAPSTFGSVIARDPLAIEAYRAHERALTLPRAPRVRAPRQRRERPRPGQTQLGV